tara:strand:- start:248 stop:826 length:579 start_codon:yes stop_codon:yes gene_type:complete
VSKIYKKLLLTIINEIVPKTKVAISNGNKVFGGAILNKSDLSIISVGTNNEVQNPLWHGEISTLKVFFEIPYNKRPNVKDCIFLSTHEPCSLCLSAITWSGFDNFYYLFPYSDTKDKFNIPHDLNILSEVFNINNGKYNKMNSYWKSYSIMENVLKSSDKNLITYIDQINKIYDEFSQLYQKIKSNNQIPLN